MKQLLSLLLCLAVPAHADSLVAKATIRSHTILTSDHIVESDQVFPSAVSDPAEVIGMETREILYAGRPILASQLGLPALVHRNQRVVIVYQSTAMQIVTEGRALGRAGLGEEVDVINTSSRTRLRATVVGDSRVHVSNGGTPDAR